MNSVLSGPAVSHRTSGTTGFTETHVVFVLSHESGYGPVNVSESPQQLKRLQFVLSRIFFFNLR